MSTTTRNGIWRIPVETQERILEMSTEGIDVGTIARWVKINRQSVEVVIEQGMICHRPLRNPKRCPGCGSKIVIAPCLGCEMARREKLNKQKAKVMV